MQFPYYNAVLRAYLDRPANVSTKVSSLKTQYSEDNTFVNSVCKHGFRTDWGGQLFLAREPHWTQIRSILASKSTIKTYLIWVLRDNGLSAVRFLKRIILRAFLMFYQPKKNFAGHIKVLCGPYVPAGQTLPRPTLGSGWLLYDA